MYGGAILSVQKSTYNMCDLCARGKNQQLLWNNSHAELAINKQLYFGIEDLPWFYDVVIAIGPQTLFAAQPFIAI